MGRLVTSEELEVLHNEGEAAFRRLYRKNALEDEQHMKNALEDEQRWILENPERCSCGHLEIFHNGHCCCFCLVEGCECRG